MDSKYFANQQQFERDVQKYEYEKEQLKDNLRVLIMVDPAKMEDRYRQAVSVMLEIKREFDL